MVNVAAAQVQLTPRRCAIAHPWLFAATYELLRQEAEKRGQHPDQLAAEILDNVLVRKLVRAVIDHK